jgi:hypothetical protein
MSAWRGEIKLEIAESRSEMRIEMGKMENRADQVADRFARSAPICSSWACTSYTVAASAGVAAIAYLTEALSPYPAGVPFRALMSEAWRRGFTSGDIVEAAHAIGIDTSPKVDMIWKLPVEPKQG